MQQRAATCACKPSPYTALPVHLSDRFWKGVKMATIFGIVFFAQIFGMIFSWFWAQFGTKCRFFHYFYVKFRDRFLMIFSVFLIVFCTLRRVITVFLLGKKQTKIKVLRVRQISPLFSVFFYDFLFLFRYVCNYFSSLFGHCFSDWSLKDFLKDFGL